MSKLEAIKVLQELLAAGKLSVSEKEALSIALYSLSMEEQRSSNRKKNRLLRMRGVES